MTRRTLFLLLIVFMLSVSLACNLPFLSAATPKPMATPSVSPEPKKSPVSTEAPGDLTAAPTPVAPGNNVTVGNISFVIPTGLSNSATHEVIARAEGQDIAPWEAAPEYTKFQLEDYLLTDKFHQPQLYVYPAEDYAALSPGAAESIKRLQALTSGVGMDVNNDTLPFVPFFNAAQMFAAQVMPIQFRNGSGYRMLTQYGQAFSPVNNRDLFYHFEGLTSDGKYYIIAILPVTAPFLSADSAPNSPLPADGILFDFNTTDPVAYFDAITQKLNNTASDRFSPSLAMLDALVQSLSVTAP
jgi:hypothetical protein